MTKTTERLRALNDQLRTTGKGGSVVITAGVAALPAVHQAEIFAAVQGFDRFTPDNDPYGEHDCASLQAAGQEVMFKIDYYDRTLSHHSPDPADPDLTRRVLTIMLVSEY